MQVKDGTQARGIGTVGEAANTKAKTGTGLVNPNSKARTDRMIGARQRGKARAARKAAAQATYTALTRPVTLTGGRSQTDHSRAHNQKK